VVSTNNEILLTLKIFDSLVGWVCREDQKDESKKPKNEIADAVASGAKQRHNEIKNNQKQRDEYSTGPCGDNPLEALWISRFDYEHLSVG